MALFGKEKFREGSPTHQHDFPCILLVYEHICTGCLIQCLVLFSIKILPGAIVVGCS